MLSSSRPIRAQFWTYALPYFLYVAGNVLHPWLGRPVSAALGGIAAAVSLLYFASHGHYRFGNAPRFAQWFWALLIGISATGFWVILYRLSAGILAGGPESLSRDQMAFDWPYLLCRGLASTLIVPFAEELFMRVFVLETAEHHVRRSKEKAREWSWQLTLDENPPDVPIKPASWKAACLTALVFALGHTLVAWLPAFAWFMVTQGLYRKTRNLWTVIAMHALANGTVFFLVAHWKMNWLW